MALIDRDILTITEPTIKLDEIFIEDMDSDDAQKESSTKNPTPPIKQQVFEGGIVPVIQIGSNKIGQDDLEDMRLNLNGFIPTMSISVMDTFNKLSSIEYPLDGTVVSLYLRPRPIEEYRPIRIDFDIMGISSVPRLGNIPALYTFDCVMKVPLLNADVLVGFGEGNSFDHLIECSEGLGLGFASNEDSTDDIMNRICAFQTREEFIKLTTLSAYKDDESFFTSYIDPYYYLCLVNVNKQFSEEDVIETSPIVEILHSNLENNYQDNDSDSFVEGGLRLTNDQSLAGSNMFIKSYNLINNSGGIWMQNGYSREIKYLNLNENIIGETDGLESFLITPLNTPGSENNKIPLRGRIDEDYWKFNNKVKYIGKQSSEDFSNMHSNYMYAIGNNYGNMDEIEKMIMEIELDTVNWSLYRYQRIPVIIYNDDEIGNKTLEGRDEQLGEDTQPQNLVKENGEYNNEGPNRLLKNEFLSGYYVISEISYNYNKEDSKITQSLKLLRREWPISAKNKDN